MTLLFDVLGRVLAGLLIAALFGQLIGDGGSPIVYLVSVVAVAGVVAMVLDGIGSPFAPAEPERPRRDAEPS